MGREDLKEEHHQEQPSKQAEPSPLLLETVHLRKDAKELVRVYCGLTNKRISDFISDLVLEELKEFKEQLTILKKFKK